MGFIQGVADWILSRRAKGKGGATRKGFATTAIRKASTVFFGIGAYTISEVLFYAGQQPLLFFFLHHHK